MAGATVIVTAMNVRMSCRALVCRVYALLSVCREEMSAIEQSWARCRNTVQVQLGNVVLLTVRRGGSLTRTRRGWFAESQVYDVSGAGWLGLRADQSVMELWQRPV